MHGAQPTGQQWEVPGLQAVPVRADDAFQIRRWDRRDLRPVTRPGGRKGTWLGTAPTWVEERLGIKVPNMDASVGASRVRRSGMARLARRDNDAKLARAWRWVLRLLMANWAFLAGFSPFAQDITVGSKATLNLLSGIQPCTTLEEGSHVKAAMLMSPNA